MKGFLIFLAACGPTVFAQPLTITTAPSLPVATVNQAYSVQISATGGSTPYLWHFESGLSPSARFVISSAGVLSGTPTTADLGVLTFYVQVTDYTGLTVTKQFSATVQTTQPLALNTTAFAAGVVGIPYSLQLAGAGGTPPYKWAVLPAIVTFPVPGQVSPGLQLDSGTGLVSGTPATAGSFGFTITLTDAAQGSVSKPYTLTVSAGGPLGIGTSSLPNGTVGASYSQTLQSVGGVPPYKWSVTTGSLPTGLSLDASGGVISGAPLTPGASNFTVTLTDSAATPNMVKQALTITAVAPPPLVITTASLPGTTVGAPYSQKMAATGGVGAYHWSVSAGALPAGLSLAADTGLISGVASAAGSSTFTIQATDSAAGTAATTSKQFSVTISQLTPVSVAAGTLTAGSVNTPYSQNLPASGGAAPYSWTLLAGALPPGLLLSNSGTLSGVPSVAATFGFTAQVVDSAGGTAIGTFAVVLGSSAVSLVPLIVPSAVMGAPYPSQVLAATGGSPPYVFSISGSLPAGINLTNGLISGTPTATGTSNFTIVVTDSSGGTATSPQQIVVRPSVPPDLVLSTGGVFFSLSAGAADVPDPQSFTIASSNTGTILNYQVTVSPAAPWLTVTGGLGTTVNTPGGISVSLNSQALALASSTTPYATNISVTCVTPSSCAGSVQKVAISLTVAAPPAQLTLTKTLVALSAGLANSQNIGIFGIQNAGGGTIAVNSVTAADSWLTVSGAPSTLAAGPPSSVTLTANAGSLAAGLYRTTVTVATSAGSANLPVTLLVATTPTLTLNPAGQLFQMAAGGVVGNPAGSLEVLAGGAATINWSAATRPGAAWLIVKTATGSSTPSNPGVLNYAIDPAASAALAAGAYYGTVRVTSDQVANTSQDFLVVLNVAAAGTSPDPDPEPSGLLFIANGSTALPPQTLTLYASSATAVAYQAAAITSAGTTPWLSVTPTSGTVSASAPGHPGISVSPAGLVPGVYRGVVTYQFSAAALRSVNVTYIVPNIAGGLPFARPADVSSNSLAPHALGNCTPIKLVETASGFPSNFTSPAAWPTPLSVTLTDDCGTAIANGSVDVTFSNGDPAIPLSADVSTPGRYAGTWTPRGPVSQLTITASATAPALASARVQISGKVTPNLAPALTPGATLNVFNPVVGGGIAPGTAVQIYGSNFAPAGTSAQPTALPFPTTLSNVSVVMNGIPAPLYYVSPGQINAQAPFELTPGVPYQILVSANGALTTPDRFVTAPGAPGIAAFGNGNIIAQHLDFSLVTDASPARPGEFVILYLTGLGSAVNQPASGSAAPIPPTDPLNPVTLTLAGSAVPTAFVGLTPSAVGLYQIDFTVPVGTPDGSQVLTVSQAGAVSNVTILPVHQ